ncbi:MAG: acyl-CoA dehydrogenase [Proteobacteria bacterium]|nr:acyl-CoA dehydrogenase [Pseudomonadota bacterium]
MTSYSAPLDDYRFLINDVIGLEQVTALPGCGEMNAEMVEAILSEAGRFGSEVLAPLNQSGDREGSSLENGIVRTPKGFKEAYKLYAEGGWTAMTGAPEFGGQSLPWLVTAPINEMMNAANMAFYLCPGLTQGAVELLEAHGSAEQQETYIARLLSGEWCATMNLTEPQAGSDLGSIRTRAVKEDKHYRISGQKIFITYGEHDFTDNIIHLVLARTPDAPEGTRGISLFIVPKFMINDDGSLGGRNDLRCVSLEHKLGIHASPTAVMSYGDDGGAIGYLVGEENRGLEFMFTMMNNARLLVGSQGVAMSELATQRARAYARERVQGRAAGSKDAVSILNHADVRRMLMSMMAQTDAVRLLLLYTSAQLDVASKHPDENIAAQHQQRVDLLTPVVKAWSTDIGIESASTGIQVHGGMGYIEETGAAQILRDARIATIYEGTNGIQANDLLGRKIVRDEGRALSDLLAEIRADAKKRNDPRLSQGCDALNEAADWIVKNYADNADAVTAGAVHLLRLVGIVTGGWLMGRSATAAKAKLDSADGDQVYLNRKIVNAAFFSENYLPEASLLLEKIKGAGQIVGDTQIDFFE